MITLKKARRSLFLLGLFKIPMIGFVGPKLIEMDDDKIVLKIPYKRRTLNHLKSIYLGAMVIGADLVAGFHAYAIGESMNKNISIVFKNFNSTFFKRPESDLFFVCIEGVKVKKMIERSIEKGERITEDIFIKAYTNYPDQPEHIADFTLGLSVKNK